MPYTPTTAATAAVARLAANLADAPAPGPWTALQSGAVSSLPTAAVFDAAAVGAWAVETKSASFNAAAGILYRIAGAAGNVTATLPAAAANAGRRIAFVKAEAAHTLILGGTVSGEVNPSRAARYTVWTVVSDGAEWMTS